MEEKRKKMVAGDILDAAPANQSAIALEYEKGDVAPKVIASGEDY